MNTFEWRDLERNPYQLSELPAVNLKDLTESSGSFTYGKELRDLTTMLEIGVVESTDAPTEIRDLLADLEVSINTDRTWGGLALDSELLLNEMEIEHLENKIMVARIPLRITFGTLFGNPRAQ